MKSGITAHTVVKNEDRFIWFAINSVLNFVDQLIIYDTGSQDLTVKIIKSISSPKIIFQQFGNQTADQITFLRQQQLTRTKTSWFLILDGDEVWWQMSIKQIRQTTKTAHKNLWGIITPTINSIGDIFHYQDESAGRYKFGNHTGHLAVRVIRRDIPGIHLKNTYPLEGYYDATNTLVTDYANKLIFQQSGYLHLTNLSRSTLPKDKAISRIFKYELGNKFSKHFEYPEVLSKKYPSFVPNPFVKMNQTTYLKAALITPLKKLKRMYT